MAVFQNPWQRNFPAKKCGGQEEELLVFGYSCRLFRDDERALYIDQGKHLIPWMGDENLLIDRYDARGYLYDLKRYEPKPDIDPLGGLTEAEKRIEERCEEERYLELYKDVQEEEMYEEEEVKRLRASLASGKAYHEIGFNYESREDDESIESEERKEEEDQDEPYSVPDGLTVPAGLELPQTLKAHTIIEKTAIFVSQHGPQMEIILKTKQATNPQFNFLSIDSTLYPYYRHLVVSIRAGTYKPKPPEQPKKHDDDDDDDDHYLHPSLFAAKPQKETPFTVPNLVFLRGNEDDAYARLVKNLKDKLFDHRSSSPVPVEKQKKHSGSKHTVHKTDKGHHSTSKSSTPPPDEQIAPLSQNMNSDQPPPPGEGPSIQLPQIEESFDDGNDFTECADANKIIPPPPDLQPVIDKMAIYVAKNGEDFEIIVKSKSDKRFEFLESWNQFHQYYLFKKNYHIKLQEREEEANKQQDHPQEPEEQDDNESISEIQQEAEESIQSEEDIGEELQHSEENSTGAPPIETTAKEKVLAKPIKGPVSFSIKPKDSEVQSLEKKSALLLDETDSEEEKEPREKEQPKETKENVETTNNIEQGKDDVIPDTPPSVSESCTGRSTPAEGEHKSTKRFKPEELEARLAEEKRKDRLAAAARERLAQQSRERQLQLERKRRAALFLTMLNKTKCNSPQEMSEEKPDVEDSKGVPEQKEVVSGMEVEEFNLGLSPLTTIITSPTRAGAITPDTRNSPVSSTHSSPQYEITQQRISLKPLPVLSAPDGAMEPLKSSSKSHSKSKKSSRSHRKSRSRSPSKSKHKKMRNRSRSHSRGRSHSKRKRPKTPPLAYSQVRRSPSPKEKRSSWSRSVSDRSRRK
ncbi:splicing factor, suppressor of white-apricot homolog isoform X1 [Limulus polyphemus]|uniref:Splicing factor, suppressor of white-apricot homolog isoform X1 n=2 Tax=Limulus polyphemus TaxID=6850 RepID=A0ABM1B7X4_LIMPO|nr:splicing factor, suppressor of white-apricot homolog isoform X1 [Limulus polyphemus]